MESDNTQKILDLARAEVAARRTAREPRSEQPWLWAFVGLTLTLLLGVFFLPIQGLDYRLQMVVHGVCAQAHYLYIGPWQMPLCARNTGIYAGFLGSLLFLVAIGRGRAAKLPPIGITVILALGAIAMVIDGFNSMLLDLGGYNLYTPHNELRVITGLLMGSAIGVFMLMLFNLALRYRPLTDQRMLRSPLEFGALMLLNVLLYLLAFFSPAFLYYPLALFSVAGIVGVLFIANLFVVAMVSGLEGRVSNIRQLVRPATFSLVLTTGELFLLSSLRIWVEGAAHMNM